VRYPQGRRHADQGRGDDLANRAIDDEAVADLLAIDLVGS
jgi:hypothetical protein